jgi:hypothetical protein
MGIALLVGIVCALMIPKFKKSSEVLRYSARPLKNITGLLLVPFVQLFCQAVFFMLMLGLMYGVITQGDIERIDYSGVPGGEIKTIEYNISWRYTMIFFVPICLLWMQVTISAGEFIAATATSIWVFSQDKHTLSHPIRTGVKNLFRYHMGSIILASCLIAPFRPIKAVLGWTKGVLRRNPNGCTTCLANCCCCVLNIHNMFLQYLHADLFAFMALLGNPFWSSGKRAYFLKMRQKEYDLKASSYAGEFLIWVSTLIISLAGPTFTMFWIVFMDDTFVRE